MNIDSLLIVYAEIMVAVAGFGSVVAVLSRPLSPFRRQRFLQIIGTALAGVLAALIPGWLSQSGLTSPRLWQAASAVLLALCSITGFFGFPRKSERENRFLRIVNPLTTYLMYTCWVAMYVLLTVNLFGIFANPSFSLYYATLLLGLASSFILFLDAVVREDE